MELFKYILSYVFNYDLMAVQGWKLWRGLVVTAEIVSLSVPIGFLLAYPISQARMSKNALLSACARGYITFFRGTPLLCQLFLFYYGAGELHADGLMPAALWPFFREAFFICIVSFSINTAAYQAEILRGAIQSVPKGQWEAASALGLHKFAASLRVIWPQALLVAMRPLGNELISMIKASAIASLITVRDLMAEAKDLYKIGYDMSVYITVAVIYLIIVEIIRRVWRWWEGSISKHVAVSRH
ncbi:ABC transporter permease [Methylovirgula sp. 4M-Z18]|uniref:ABC transporter permease n=1 Tax=Methylovirgula sp. 4M-Z18 TaxID=2293567 RepID=UPI000E2F0AFC|nr:ABC transporter permease subunit [Methylovirgula sp. 4M-Z18]RFB80044.1 ABC transporter permease subunit [Methylovirgula sp. 4M-Z18]